MLLTTLDVAGWRSRRNLTVLGLFSKAATAAEVLVAETRDSAMWRGGIFFLSESLEFCLVACAWAARFTSGARRGLCAATLRGDDRTFRQSGQLGVVPDLGNISVFVSRRIEDHDHHCRGNRYSGINQRAERAALPISRFARRGTHSVPYAFGWAATRRAVSRGEHFPFGAAEHVVGKVGLEPVPRQQIEAAA